MADTDERRELDRRVALLEHELEEYRATERARPEIADVLRKARAWREACEPVRAVSPDGDPHWVVVLNKYQRDNLLWLFAAIGYVPSEHGAVEPFTFANTGDWVGEIPIMLGDTLDGTEPNQTLGDLAADVAEWKTRS